MLYLYTKEELRFRQPAQKFWEVLIEGNQSEIFFFCGRFDICQIWQRRILTKNINLKFYANNQRLSDRTPKTF